MIDFVLVIQIKMHLLAGVKGHAFLEIHYLRININLIDEIGGIL